MPLLNWVIVTAYGATGNGTTDDTASINSAIAQLNAVGRGVLYFPVGTYKTTASLTTITANCTVLGDGSQAGYGGPVSLINSTSTTAPVFTSTAAYTRYERLAIVNTAGAAKTAGAAIVAGSGAWNQRTMYDDLYIANFYDGIDSRGGTYWTMRDCVIFDSYRYGIRIRNTADPDAGDWLLDHCSILNNGLHTTDAAIRLESSGAGRIVNCEILGALGFNLYGIDVVGDGTTSVLLVSGCSIESYGNAGVRSVGSWPYQTYSNMEFGQYSNSTGSAFNLSSGSDIVIDIINLASDSSPAKGIVSASMSRLVVGGSISNNGFVAIGP